MLSMMSGWTIDFYGQRSRLSTNIGQVSRFCIVCLQFIFRIMSLTNHFLITVGILHCKKQGLFHERTLTIHKFTTSVHFVFWITLQIFMLSKRNKKKNGVHTTFTLKTGNESDRETNKSCEPWSGSQAVCLFRTPIHYRWTQKKRQSFFIFTVLPTKTLSKCYKFKIPTVAGT